MNHDWPSLWELEPALRPFKLEPPHRQRMHWAGTNEHGRARVIDESVAATLCCMAAVRWLLENGIGIEPAICGFVTTSRAGGAADPPPSKAYHALDAALFAACEAVIDARAKQPSQTPT